MDLQQNATMYQQPMYGGPAPQPMNQQPYPYMQPMGAPYAQPMPGMNGGFQGATYNFSPTPMPMNTQSLSEEEIQELINSRGGKFDINVPRAEFLRAMCNHRHNGQEVVQQINDGSGEVFCPVCYERWNPELITKEQAEQLVQAFVNQLQILKWVGNLPVDVIRDYFTIIPLLRKFPDLVEICTANYKKYTNGQAYMVAGNNSIYNQYELLMGRGMGYDQSPYMVNQPFVPANMQVMSNQPMYNPMPQQMPPMNTPYGQPQMNQGYYGQAVQQNNPAINPMQMQPGMNPQQTVYGNGGVQPYMPAAMPQQPMMNAPVQQQAPNFSPIQQQPVAPQPAVQSTPEQNNGTVATKDQTINL